MSKSLSSCLFLSLLFLGSHSRCLAQDWPMYQHDPAHTSYSDITFDPRGLEFAWTSPTGYGSPVIAGDAIYAASSASPDSERVVSCFDLRTGDIRWSTTVYGASSVSFAGDTLLTTSYNCRFKKSLEALDPLTGNILYSVPFGENDDYPGVPVPYQDPTGQWNVIVCDSVTNFYSIRVGETSGFVNWAVRSNGMGLPTIVGNSAIVSTSGKAEAIDLSTGARNKFHTSSSFGGGSQGVAYDASRQQFYFCNHYGYGDQMLMAYHYTDNDNITLVWTRPIGRTDNDVAIGPDGKVYMGDFHAPGNPELTIYEIDPATGDTLRSVPVGGIATNTPLLINGYLFADGSSDQLIYDLSDFSLVKTLPGGGGAQDSMIRPFDAVAPGVFAVASSRWNNSSTFTVYTPEPSTLSLFALCGVAIFRRRRARKD